MILVATVAVAGEAQQGAGGAAGDEIVFASTPAAGGAGQLKVMSPSGRVLRRLTARGSEPEWSADGRQVAFSRMWETPTAIGSSIWVVGARGGGERRVTKGRESHWLPTWSPDGRRIAFEAWTGRGSAIAVAPARGGARRLLTGARGRDHMPDWSPDGGAIVFVRGEDRRADIWVMRADGGGARRVVRTSGVDADPAWSPDGRTIAFGSSRDGRSWHVYTVRSDGTGLTRLARGGQPDWSPDGRRIVFASQRDGDPEIYVMNADGSGERKLTDNRGTDMHPSWRR